MLSPLLFEDTSYHVSSPRPQSLPSTLEGHSNPAPMLYCLLPHMNLSRFRVLIERRLYARGEGTWTKPACSLSA